MFDDIEDGIGTLGPQVDPLIPKEHVKAVCRMGEGAATCAYLAFAPAASCAKAMEPGLVQMIEARVAAGTMNARGDNCSGPPEFQTEGR